MIDTILTRTSIRKFTDQPVSDEDIHTILRAGMSGPSTKEDTHHDTRRTCFTDF